LLRWYRRGELRLHRWQLTGDGDDGFIGNLQLIVFLGILYVVAADDIIDHHLSSYTPRVSNLLRVVLLPSYLAITLLGIAWIIP